MFIAHLPAGYLLSRGLLSRFSEGRLNPHQQRTLMFAGLIASVLPDVDWLYYYLFSHQNRAHHTYWTHVPLFWLTFGLLAYLLNRLANHPLWNRIVFFIVSNALLHLLLDTVAGKIRWLYPWSSQWFQIIAIPHSRSGGVMNYLTQWMMLLELSITGCAFWVAIQSSPQNPLRWQPRSLLQRK